MLIRSEVESLIEHAMLEGLTVHVASTGFEMPTHSAPATSCRTVSADNGKGWSLIVDREPKGRSTYNPSYIVAVWSGDA